MKAMFGQYAKVVILVLATSALLTFLFSTGENSFIGKMQVTKPEADYGKEDNSDLMDEIAARKPPVITQIVNTLESGREYTFTDLVTVSFMDDKASDQKLFVKKLVTPSGDIITNETELAAPIRVTEGKYSVTYRAEETFKGAPKHSEVTFTFIGN